MDLYHETVGEGVRRDSTACAEKVQRACPVKTFQVLYWIFNIKLLRTVVFFILRSSPDSEEEMLGKPSDKSGRPAWRNRFYIR